LVEDSNNFSVVIQVKLSAKRLLVQTLLAKEMKRQNKKPKKG